MNLEKSVLGLIVGHIWYLIKYYFTTQVNLHKGGMSIRKALESGDPFVEEMYGQLRRKYKKLVGDREHRGYMKRNAALSVFIGISTIIITFLTAFIAKRYFEMDYILGTVNILFALCSIYTLFGIADLARQWWYAGMIKNYQHLWQRLSKSSYHSGQADTTEKTPWGIGFTGLMIRAMYEVLRYRGMEGRVAQNHGKKLENEMHGLFESACSFAEPGYIYSNYHFREIPRTENWKEYLTSLREFHQVRSEEIKRIEAGTWPH